MRILRVTIILILFQISGIIAQESLSLNNGTELYLPLGTSICAENIIVNSGAKLIADDSSGICSSANISGDGIIQIGSSEWIAQTSGVDLGLFSVDFINPITGWAVGSAGTIVATTNKGTDWASQTSGTTNQLRGVSFVNENVGWACGLSGTILKTTSGGLNWTVQTSGTSSNEMNSIVFVDVNNGWACGDYKILRTTNGGNSWLHYDSDFSHEYKSVFFINSSIGWAVGGINGTTNSLIKKSTDEGVTWIEQSNTGNHWLYSVHFTDANNGWAVGTGGLMLKTTNGGSSWSIQTAVTSNFLRAVFFIDPFQGSAVGESGLVLHTQDGGTNWIVQTSGVAYNLYSVVFPSENHGWTVGDLGTILKSSYVPLPIELVSFSARNINQTVNLTWQTATEINNYGFEIERQETESRSQNSEWKKIGFVEGAGNSSSPKSYSYIDRNPVGGSKFLYRLKQIDTDGSYEYSEIVEIELSPEQYELFQNYPNPFNPITTIKFSLVEKSDVVLNINNILGEIIIEENLTELNSGFHEYNFDGGNLSSGVYFYSIKIGNKYNDVKKMLLLK
jgi:photosystem II stability/assembly factor-like uncharacterized protein